MAVDIFLGEPPEHIKQWIIDHLPSSSGITVNYENGTSVEVSSPFNLQTMASLQAADIVSITVPDGAEIADEQNLFKTCTKLSEITFGDTTYVPEDIESKVLNWSLGLDAEGNTHLVVLYYGNGVVVINDSGERGFKIDWNKFVGWLEDFDSSVLPEPGKSIIVPYKVDPTGEAVETEWMILSYNKDIPRFVKYKNGDTRVYMDVLPGTSLLTSFSGANVYSNKDGTGLVGTVSVTGGTPFTYGNNNTYSVPGTITVDGTEYTFCGYNVTLQSKYGLVAKYDGNLYEYPQFDSQNHNDWKTSEIREWMNGTEAVSTQKWQRSSDWNYTTGNIVGLLGRLPDANFMGNIIPTVTRTWVHSSWRDGTEDGNGCQHLADKFWLLGEGNINANVEWLKDDTSDTSIYNEVFTEATSGATKTRKRKTMKEDGTKGSAYYWWLRSAYSDYDNTVGYVYNDGSVSSYLADSNSAVLPVCLIG